MKNLKSQIKLNLSIGLIILLCFGCRKSQPYIISDDSTEEWIENKTPEYKMILETDYPYYYILSKSPQDKSPVKENIRMRKYWERIITAQSGDSIFIEANTIKSNIPGSYLKIKILCNNQVISSKEYIKSKEGECIDNCPVYNDAVSLTTSVMVK